jgi:hypothetical protein
VAHALAVTAPDDLGLPIADVRIKRGATVV